MKTTQTLITLAVLVLGLSLAACDSSPTEPDEPCTFADDNAAITRPEKIFFPQPQYSEDARRLRIQGVVIARAVINCDGRVTNVTILQALYPSLDQEVINAIERWTFKPAMQHGKAVAVYYNLTVNFRLQGQDASVVTEALDSWR